MFPRVVDAKVDDAEATKFCALEVVALEVEALEVMKLEEEPKREVMYELRAFSTLENNVPETFRLVMLPVAATS